MTATAWHVHHEDALEREDAVRRQRAGLAAFAFAVARLEQERRRWARLAAFDAVAQQARDAAATAARSAQLETLDELAERCPDCGSWTLTVAPRAARHPDGSYVYRPRVNGRPVAVHRCTAAA